jgi:hypothetical protein
MKSFQDFSFDLSKEVDRFCRQEKKRGKLTSRTDVMNLLDNLKWELYSYVAYDLFQNER